MIPKAFRGMFFRDAAVFIAMIPTGSPMLETLTIPYGDSGFWVDEVSSAFEDAVSQLPCLQVYEGPLLCKLPPRGLSPCSSLKRVSLDMRYAPIEGLQLL
ncbi:hypothetical protein CONPUDRAFT_164448, partial [Coniophora puteana RWD-64-598 SS2]